MANMSIKIPTKILIISNATITLNEKKYKRAHLEPVHSTYPAVVTVVQQNQSAHSGPGAEGVTMPIVLNHEHEESDQRSIEIIEIQVDVVCTTSCK